MTKSSTRVAAPAPTPAWRQPLPSRDTQVLESPFVWMKEKNEADQKRTGVPPHLWCVHGKYYDLSKFKHPGGPDWLKYTQGGDVTVAYETHHLNVAKCDKILAKYYVKDGPKDALGEFSFNEKGLFRTMKARVAEKIGLATGPTTTTMFMIATLLGTHLLGFGMACVFPSVLGWIGTFIAGALLLSLWGLGHNFMHQRDCIWRFLLDFTIFSSHNWRISHAISHHLYPNTDIDGEASGVEPFERFLSNQPKNNFLINITYHLFAFNVGFIDLARRFVNTVAGRERPLPESLINIAQLGLLWYFLGWQQGLARWYVMHGIGTYLLLVTSYSVHRTEIAWTEGDPDAPEDYGEHTAKTTHDHSMDLNIFCSFLFYAGLNNHVLHHMFPTVDHTRLHQLHPILVSTLKEYKIPYKVFRFPTLLWSAFRRHDMIAPSAK